MALPGLDKLNADKLELQLLTPYFDMSQFKYCSPQKLYLELGKLELSEGITPTGLRLYKVGFSTYLEQATKETSFYIGKTYNAINHQILLECVRLVLMASLRVKTCYVRVLQTIFDNMEDLFENPFLDIVNGSTIPPEGNPFYKVFNAYSANCDQEKQYYYRFASLAGYPSYVYDLVTPIIKGYRFCGLQSVYDLTSGKMGRKIMESPSIDGFILNNVNTIDSY